MLVKYISGIITTHQNCIQYSCKFYFLQVRRWRKIYSLLLQELYIFYSALIFLYSFSKFHNFKNWVDIIAEIGGKKLQKHLLTVSENNYDNANYIGIINDYIKVPLLASTSIPHNYKTQSISSIQPMAIYASFVYLN